MLTLSVRCIMWSSGFAKTAFVKVNHISKLVDFSVNFGYISALTLFPFAGANLFKKPGVQY